MKKQLKSRLYTTPVFTAVYPNLFTPKDFNGDGNFNYSMDAAFAPEDALVLDDTISQVILDNWGAKAPARLHRPGEINGDKTKPHTLLPAEFKIYRMKCKADKGAPKVYDGRRQLITNAELVYGGMKARAYIDIAPYEVSSASLGVSLRLIYVQKVGEGERLGRSYASADSVFSDVFGDDEDII